MIARMPRPRPHLIYALYIPMANYTKRDERRKNMADDDGKTEDAITTLEELVAGAEAGGIAVIHLSTTDARLILAEIERLEEREDDAFQRGLERNLLT